MQSELERKVFELLTHGYPAPFARVADLSKRIAELFGQYPAALSDQERAGEVAIKPLDWHAEPPYHVARMFGNVYAVEAWDGGVTLSGVGGRRDFKTVSDAKAAAQADYDQRIRSALVDVPVEPVEPVALIEREVLTELAKHKTATGTVCSPLLKSKFGDKVPLYASPHIPHREGEDSAEVEQTVSSHEITDFLYKHGDLTYSAAARAVQLLTGNGYGFTSSSEARKESLLTMRKALNKIADMIDADDADLDDAINIATTALAATRSASATSAKGCAE